MNILKNYGDKINGKFNTFDRILFKGLLMPLNNPSSFAVYLHKNNVLLKDFDKFAEAQTKSLCEHIDKYITLNGVTLTYLASSKTNKKELSDEVFNEYPEKCGLVAAYSAVELCNTMTVKPNHEVKKLETTYRNTKCKHYYLYYNDEEFGHMFIKIQTWFPYTVNIYINGREYCSKFFSKENIKYEMFNNSFSYISDFSKAQEIADRILNKNLSASFNGLIKPINNLLPKIEEQMNTSYYWCIDQCEFATDINFKNRSDLEKIYKDLVETTYFTFSSQDIYSFFGRNVKYINKFNGEVISDLRLRNQGFRIKFKINNNQIKMYDKGNNLRIEVTINNPRDFKVLKEVENDETGEVKTTLDWKPMNKSITNLYRYAKISDSIITRYIKALPELEEKVPLEEINKISQKKDIGKKIISGINLLTAEILLFISIICSGNFIINGFSNKDVRDIYYKGKATEKQVNKITRMISKFRKHGLIKKVPKRNKYYLTNKGRTIFNSLLLFTNKELQSTV